MLKELKGSTEWTVTHFRLIIRVHIVWSENLVNLSVTQD